MGDAAQREPMLPDAALATASDPEVQTGFDRIGILAIRQALDVGDRKAW